MPCHVVVFILIHNLMLFDFITSNFEGILNYIIMLLLSEF